MKGKHALLVAELAALSLVVSLSSRAESVQCEYATLTPHRRTFWLLLCEEASEASVKLIGSKSEGGRETSCETNQIEGSSQINVPEDKRERILPVERLASCASTDNRSNEIRRRSGCNDGSL